MAENTQGTPPHGERTSDDKKPGSADPRLGQVYGAYRLVRRIDGSRGGGQLGEVYEAQQERTERLVALRLVDRALTADTDSQRALLAGLRGVNRLGLSALVGYQDWGVGKDGQVFLVMEKLIGMPLGDWVEQNGCIAPQEAGRLLGEVAAGLHQAHGQGLVHRGISPRKIIVVADPFGPSGGRLRLRDLGFPRTPPISPAVDRDDVLHLGECLFLLTVGKMPPALPQHRKLLIGERTLPVTLQGLLNKCLEWSPDHRPPLEFLVKGLRDLGRNALPAPSSASAPGTPPSSRSKAPPPAEPTPPPAPRRLVQGAAALALLLGGVGAGALGVSALRRPAPAAAGARLVVAQETESLCRGALLPPEGPLPPEAARPVAEQVTLVLADGKCFQPAYLGKAEIIDQQRVPLRGLREVGGVAFLPDGRLALSHGAGEAAALEVREVGKDGRLGKVVVDMDFIPTSEQEGGKARFAAGPLAFDESGSALIAVKRTAPHPALDLYWGRKSGAVQDDFTLVKLTPLPTGARGLLAPGFDKDYVYVTAAAGLFRYERKVGGRPPERPWMAVEGRALRSALPLSAQEALLVLTGSADRDPGGEPATLTVLVSAQRRGFYLVFTENPGLLAASMDGKRLVRYDPKAQALSYFRVTLPD